MTTLWKFDKEKVTSYEIPDSDLLKYSSLSDKLIVNDQEDSLDLYKMEYEKCAQRYNDIYTDAWTNFSYMAIVSGGILTFGSNVFKDNPYLSGLLACVPLFFWYMASFVPMNRYGDQVHERLKQIENIVNEKFKTRLSHYNDYEHSEKTLLGQIKRPGVRFIIFIFFSFLLVAAGWLGYKGLTLHLSGSLLFQESELKNAAALAARFKDPQDDISHYLQEKFSDNTKQLLNDYNPSFAPSSVLQKALIKELNRALEGPNLYEAMGSSNINLPPDVKGLVGSKPSGDELIHLNRIMLERNFRDEMMKSNNLKHPELIIAFVVALAVALWGLIKGCQQAFFSTPRKGKVIKLAFTNMGTSEVTTLKVLRNLLEQSTGPELSVPVKLIALSDGSPTGLNYTTIDTDFVRLQNEFEGEENVKLIVGFKGDKPGSVQVAAVKAQELEKVFDKIFAG